MTESLLKSTCLHEVHVALGARMVDFAGWEMPIQYRGIVEEHRAVRERAGCFDVSHMGRIEISGPDCVPYLQRIVTCDVAALAPGQARYTLICVEDGGILDDTILYCRRYDSFLLVCNAANTPAVLGWLAQWRWPEHQVQLEDRTAATGMIALQGPQAAGHMDALASRPVSQEVAYFQWTEAAAAGGPALVLRTGYTGEDGFEIVAAADHAVRIWSLLVDRGVQPAGLGARDTLRLEAALPLHGNDISLETNPVEAGLSWAVARDKPPFCGQEAIRAAAERGPRRRLIGFEVTGRGIPRAHCPILADGRRIGESTSGGFAPTLRKGIGMGYVEAARAAVGTPLEIDIRGTLVPAVVVRRPFYKRAR